MFTGPDEASEPEDFMKIIESLINSYQFNSIQLLQVNVSLLEDMFHLDLIRSPEGHWTCLIDPLRSTLGVGYGC